MSNEENSKDESSNEENVNKAVETAKSLLSSFLQLKTDNPKVFYGVVGGVVLLLLIMMFSGGGSSSSSSRARKQLIEGQRYVLQTPNTYDKNATIRLVATPGNIAAYDDTEEDDRVGGCKHMPQGTPVTILQFQDFAGKSNAFAQVQFEQGECKGQTAWTLSINIK